MSRFACLVDTNVLWQPSSRDWLTNQIEAGRLQVYVPTLVHAERIRQVADRHGEQFAIDVIRQLVEASMFQLLPFDERDAETVADIWLTLKAAGRTEAYWQTHRFDILLCAIARSRSYHLITSDEGDHFKLIDRMTITELKTQLEENN